MMRHSRKAATGFTLVEAMMAITIMAILMAIAVPSFKDASLSSQLRASANDLAASVYLARSEALKRNTVVTLCMSSNGATCAASGGWEQGWIVLSGAALTAHPAAPTGQRIRAGGITSLSFQPTAVGATAATFTVCRATPRVGREERVVTIDATGRPWITRTTNASCP
ncbi:MAG TPA: GspH/FimT family pseudopilin [Steroidobacteraceae bacterium]|jgi:type IV fimbrial biogenesis protein FimT|nr:GspH/FimT family pseudopilin [Steroidobacteraceae bacterium]